MNNNIVNLAYLNKSFKKSKKKVKRKKLLGGAAASNEKASVDFTINRKYNGEKKLVLGCGNNPKIMSKEYRSQHLHQDAYTIDIDGEMNPSCLTDLTLGKFCNLPDNVFEEVVCEGFFLNLNEADKFILEIKRVSKEDAVINCDFKLNGTYRSRQGYWDNFYGFKPYINFDEINYFKQFQIEDLETDKNGYLKIYVNNSLGKIEEINQIQDLSKKTFHLKFKNVDEYLDIDYNKIFQL